MEKVTDYIIAMGDAAEITKVVNEQIKAGYEPFGSAFLYAPTRQIIQPMVKKVSDITPQKFR